MKKEKYNLITLSSVVALAGFILSGPVGFLVVRFSSPQPAWQSSYEFARSYQAIQDIPYYFGFLLVGGMLMFTVAHFMNFKSENTVDLFHLTLSVAWTIIFAVVILFNYICQITFVRHLARHYTSSNDAAIAIFSMANPSSLCWAIEMWGYGFLGIANWLMSPYYRQRNRLIYVLLISNGIISVLTAILTVIDNGWLLTSTGLTSYIVWNVLMIAVLCLVYSDSKKFI